MGVLDQIIAHKKQEVAELKALYPEALLQKSSFFKTPAVSLKKYLARPDLVGIIAEIKRRSPSKGEIHSHISVEQLSIGYMQAGASALSILTDKKFFGGSNDDLKTARRFNFCPILRKEFIVDPYQLIEAKSIGADVVLLIARVLEAAEMKSLSQRAHDLGLEVLIEVHEERELEAALQANPDVVGINNRDLDTLQINIDRSFKLGAQVPQSVLKIAESGLSEADTLIRLRQAGFNGFLIGESFMKTSKPEQACAVLIDEVRRLNSAVDILSV